MVIVGRGTHAVELDVSFCKITSNSPRNEYDVVVERWEEAGIARPSIVRCSKIMTINKNKLIARVAKLDKEETQNVLEAVCRYIVD